MNNIIYIVSILHDDRAKQQKYDYCTRSWKNWALQHNSEVVVLSEPLYEYNYMKPNWYKYYVFKLLDNMNESYDKVAIVDADTLVHRNCPNFFELTNDTISVVPNYGSLDWVHRSIEIYGSKLFNNTLLHYWEYFNSGFMVVDSKYSEFFSTVIDYYHDNQLQITSIEKEYGIGNDQTIFNYLCKIHNIPLNFLSYRYNLQDIGRRDGLDIDILENSGYIYHLNCWPKPNPGYWMEKLYERLWTINEK